MSGPLDFLSTPSPLYGAPSPLPMGISQAVSGFMWLHEIWRWKGDWARIRESSGNTYAFFAGFTVSQLGAGKSLPVETIARIAFAADTQIKAKRQLDKVRTVWSQFASALLFRDSLPLHRIEPFQEHERVWRPLTSLLFDPVTERSVERFFQSLKLRIHRIFVFAMQFLYEVFILSHYCLLLQEALCGSEASKAYAVQRMFLNWGDLLEELSENRPYLTERLLAMRDGIHDYLGLEVDELIHACEVALDAGEVAHSLLQSQLVQDAKEGLDSLVGKAKEAAGDVLSIIMPHMKPALPPAFGQIQNGVDFGERTFEGRIAQQLEDRAQRPLLPGPRQVRMITV